jgi:hypothetical protein
LEEEEEEEGLYLHLKYQHSFAQYNNKLVVQLKCGPMTEADSQIHGTYNISGSQGF